MSLRRNSRVWRRSRSTCTPAVMAARSADRRHEQLFARVEVEYLGDFLAVVAVGGHPGQLEHLGQLAPQHRDALDALGERGVRVQAEEPVLPRHGAIRPEPLHRDVVQVAGPVHGRAGVRLRDDQPLRLQCARLHGVGQGRERAGPDPVVPQDAEPGAGNGGQRHAVRAGLQVVLAIAEEREVPVRQPAQQLGDLSRGVGRRRRRPRATAPHQPARAPVRASAGNPRPRPGRRREPGAGRRRPSSPRRRRASGSRCASRTRSARRGWTRGIGQRAAGLSAVRRGRRHPPADRHQPPGDRWRPPAGRVSRC